MSKGLTSNLGAIPTSIHPSLNITGSVHGKSKIIGKTYGKGYKKAMIIESLRIFSTSAKETCGIWLQQAKWQINSSGHIFNH